MNKSMFHTCAMAATHITTATVIASVVTLSACGGGGGGPADARSAQTISFSAIGNQTIGAVAPALVASSTSGLPVTFSSATLAVCTVSGNAVTLVTVGSCTVNANQTGNASYSAATEVSRTFTVANAAVGPTAQTITFAAPSNQTMGVATTALAATSTSGLPVTLSSTTPSVCTVSGSALTLVAAGSCTVNANQAGSAIYAAAATVTRTFTVAPAPAQSVAGPAEGLWIESFYGGTGSTYVLVEPDGQMWGFPDDSVPYGTPSIGAWVPIKGNISAVGGTVTGTFRDVLITSCSLVYSSCPVNGLASSTSLSVSGAYQGLVPAFSFNSTKRVSSTATVSVPAGTWTMAAGMTGVLIGAQGTLIIGADKSVTVTNISGCAFSGTLNPVPSGQYFRLTVSAVSGICSTGITAGQINGVVFQTTDLRPNGALYVMWHDAAYKRVFWAAGYK